jgi:hypothetical protein
MATHQGGDDIVIDQENDDHDNDNVDILVDNTDGTGNVNVPAGGAAARGTAGTTNFNLQVEQKKIPEFSPRARLPFWPWILSGDWRTLPRQTDGPTHRPTTILPTHSATRHKNGYHQWSTWMTMKMTDTCGQTLRTSLNRNTQSRPTKD